MAGSNCRCPIQTTRKNLDSNFHWRKSIPCWSYPGCRWMKRKNFQALQNPNPTC